MFLLNSLAFFIIVSSLSAIALSLNLHPVVTVLVPPAVTALVQHLVMILTQGEIAIRALDGMLNHPRRIATAFRHSVMRNLPAPLWLVDWLQRISGALEEVRDRSERIDQAVAGLEEDAQAQGTGLLALITRTMGFVEHLNRLTETVTAIPATMFDLTRIVVENQARIASLHDNVHALHNHISATTERLSTRLDHRTSLSADVDFQLCFDNVHRALLEAAPRVAVIEVRDLLEEFHLQLGQVAMQATVNELRERLEVVLQLIQPVPAPRLSQIPPAFRPASAPHSLSPLPTDNALGLIFPHAQSAPASPSTSSRLSYKEELGDDSDKENEDPASPPYNPALTPWGHPELTAADQSVHWSNRTWAVGTYCGNNYEYFSYGPPHALRFAAVSMSGRHCFANTKRDLGRLVMQDAGAAFTMSGV